MSIFRSMLTTAVMSSAGSLMCQTYFQKTYGKSEQEYATCVVETSDGDIMLGGSTFSCTTIPGTNDMHLVKCDRYGNVIWSKHYYAGTIGVVTDMVAAPDGGVVMTSGITRIAPDGTPLWGWDFGIGDVDVRPDSTILGVYTVSGVTSGFGMVAFDLSGDTLLHRLYGGVEQCQARDIQATPDGGAVVVGTGRVTGNDFGAFIAKLDDTGELLWSNALTTPYPRYAAFNSVCLTPDGGYLTVGNEGHLLQGTPLVVRFNAAGDTLWTRKYDVNACQLASATSTNVGFVITSEGRYEDSLSCLLQLDAMGNLLRRVKPFEGRQYSGLQLAPLSDGALAICGTVGASVPDEGMLLMVVQDDLNGLWCPQERPLWDTLGTSLAMNAVSFTEMAHVQLTDWAPQDYNCSVLTVDTLCTSGDVGLAEASTTPISIGPNPTSGDLHIAGLHGGEFIELRDLTGRTVLDLRATADYMELSIPNGFFLLSIFDRHRSPLRTEKITCLR